MVFLCISLMAWGQDIETIKAKAQAGDPSAQVSLGTSYRFGWGITKNEEEAVKWYRKAAEQGYAEGQYKWGLCFDEGYGVTEDDEEAIKWYHKAAEQGHGNAYFGLGLKYQYKGYGNEAIKWYKKYADYWYKKFGDENSTTIENLKELGVAYNPRTKETTYLNSSASDKESQTEQPHSFSYTYNPNGLYIESTDETNVIRR